jgi:hypothetical protein
MMMQFIWRDTLRNGVAQWALKAIFAKKRGKEADYCRAAKRVAVKTTTLQMFQNAK